LKRERTPMDYFELIETFPRSGCAMCNLLRRDVDRCIDGMVYGFMDTDEMRAAFSGSRGLCAEHGWQLKQNKFGNVLGIAKLYATTLGEVLAILDAAPEEAGNSKSRFDRLLNNDRRSETSALANQLEPVTDCMVCTRIDEREEDYVSMFDRYMTEPRFRAMFEQSDGLCLPHLRAVLRGMSDPAAKQVLIERQMILWRDLKAQVDSFAAKQNYEHEGELSEAEGDSWVRAILRMGGDRSLFGTRHKGG